MNKTIITPADQERWPILESLSQDCNIPITTEDRDIIASMDAVLNDLGDNAAGLAAIQIGFARRIFLLRNGKDKNDNIYNNAYINPIVISKCKDTKVEIEGCLSLPHIISRVSRPRSVTIEYFDIQGNHKTETFNGFWAKAVMHEMDHLNGVLIVDHMQNDVKSINRTSFGMIISTTKKKQIEKRRAKNKKARKFKKFERARKSK